MTVRTASPSLSRRFRQASLGLALASSLFALPQQAQALTLILDFTDVNVTEMAGGVGDSTIKQADFSTWGFTGMNLAQIQSAILTAVTNDYLGFPNMAANPLSPLPVGKQLNISIEVSVGKNGPANGDAEFYYFGVGDKVGTEDELGHACYGCVRTAGQGAATVANGTMVGVNFTDNLQGLTSLATTDAQRINLLAGTLSHEFGHALELDHPPSAQPNPGESAFSIMGTGASPTNMPNGARVLDRAFSYAEYAQLISSVGLRDVTAVPEPSAFLLMAGGLGLLAVARRRRAAA